MFTLYRNFKINTESESSLKFKMNYFVRYCSVNNQLLPPLWNLGSPSHFKYFLHLSGGRADFRWSLEKFVCFHSVSFLKYPDTTTNRKCLLPFCSLASIKNMRYQRGWLKKCILLSRSTNAQHIHINNVLYTVSTPISTITIK